MASRFAFLYEQFTPTTTADGGTLTAGAYMALQGAGATQQYNVQEIFQEGQATSSAVNAMVFARDSTVGATTAALVTGQANGPMFPNSQATGATAFVSASTEPVRSSSTALARLGLTFNSFGGLNRWQAAPGEEWQIVGNTASAGESSLSSSNFGAPGLQAGTIIYEPL